MNIEVYCDESRQENFARAGEAVAGFTVIGSLWIRSEKRPDYNAAIAEIRARHNFRHEFKWTKITPKTQAFFLDVVRFFFAEGEEDMRFRAILLPVADLNAVTFCQGDKELMFYKFYYQVLHHWVLDGNAYRIYVDMKTSRVHNRLRILRDCLANSNLLAKVEFVQALPSHEVNLLQLADVLTGAVSCKFNPETTSTAKPAVLREIEERIGHPLAPTSRAVKKFNVFRFQPGGGW